MTRILELITHWVDDRKDAFASDGIEVSIAESASSGTPASILIDFVSEYEAGRLIVWEDGQADLAILDLVELEDLLLETREITSMIGLEDVELTVRELMTRQGRPER